MSSLPCQREPELFFAESPRVLDQAKALCAGCPVRDICLAGALDRHEPHGVWGGQIFVDGVVVATKRGRGRPRKVA
jgi:WhiB family redox-sensing transcriptional regulator